MTTFVLAVAASGVIAVVVGNLCVLVGQRRAVAALRGASDGTAAPVVGPADGSALLLHGPASVTRADRRGLLVATFARLRRPSASFWLFTLLSIGYLVLGWYLVIQRGSIIGDAQSRVADAYYVFFSRDPHVAAIGFVWNPLPSVAAMPLFALRGLWSGFVDRAFAGNVMSALFMAGAAVQLRSTLRQMRITDGLVWVLTLVFALNPMIAYYGANGMSEAPYLFFLVMAVRYLNRWLERGGITPLAWAGIALGLGYLTRYEAIVAGAAVIVLVVGVSWARAAGPWTRRLSMGLMDGVVVGLPVVVAFVGWAVTSWVITGSAFEQFTSQYGNASQIRVTGGAASLASVTFGLPRPVYGLEQLLSFGPLAPLLLLATLFAARKRLDPRVLGVVAVIGSVVAFSWLSFVSASTFGWLRYYLPMTLIPPLCLGLLVDLTYSPGRGAPLTVRRLSVAGFALVTLLAATALPATGWAMQDAKINGVQGTQPDLIGGSVAIAHDLDRRGLPPGSVVADTFSPCVSFIMMNLQHPHALVVTSDRDFERTLADPLTFHAQYLLVPPGAGYGSLDAVNRAYPTLYAQGAQLATLVTTYHVQGCPALRLYRIRKA